MPYKIELPDADGLAGVAESHVVTLRSFRDFYAFEQHVSTCRAKRGLEMIPGWYEQPVFYFSNSDSLILDGHSVFAPGGCRELDYELELGVVIGKTGRNISVEDAWDHVLGFTIVNDFSARDLQRAEMKVGLGPAKGKDFATGVGPQVVTLNELSSADENTVQSDGRVKLEMQARVNGRTLSQGNAASMYFSWPQIIAHASSDATLHRGDLLGSGTVGTGCILELGPENTGGWCSLGIASSWKSNTWECCDTTSLNVPQTDESKAMPSYRKLGSLPPKRHIKHVRAESESFLGEGLYYEHVVTTEGFNRGYSILYHLRPPTRNTEVSYAGSLLIEEERELPLRHHHFLTHQLPRSGDPINGRIPLLFNDDLVCYRVDPETGPTELYRNGAADEIIFIQSGSGVVHSQFGDLPYRRGDYIVMPRATTYQFASDNWSAESHLILESFGPCRVPERYLNPDGQLILGTPYYERDFHSPEKLEAIDSEEPTTVLVKDHERLTRVTMPHHPFDVAGWDGFVYPYTFNAWDFEPLTGTTHLPPPVQQTFDCPGFVICTFAPRYLDHHPEAIKVPYAHSNVQADEVLFYVDGEFGSRRGVELGSMTLHPGGIPHGPHPGTIMKSMDVDRTEEMAVMFDTHRPLKVTTAAMRIDDPSYPLSWLE